MIITEEEAITKECCRNRNLNCSASACMAWRWETREFNVTAGCWVVPGQSYSSTDVLIEKETDSGFCGLAAEGKG